MSNTKDEIEIKITQKDKAYLSVILCLICIVAIVCILVPRYYQLHPNPQTPSTNQTETPTNPDTPQSPDQNLQYANLYSTLVINTLKTLGMPYSTLARHLDSQNNLDVVGLQITDPQLWVLEELAFPIHSSLSSYTNNGIAITPSVINNDNNLYSQIVSFSNQLNQIAEQ